MSKKHFIALADVLRAIKPNYALMGEGEYAAANLQWNRTRNALGDFCASQSSRFDRDRWLEYVAKGGTR
jgi:hypothetical protein